MWKNTSKIKLIFALTLILNGCSSPSGKSSRDGIAPMLRVAKEARKTGNPDAAISFYNKVLQISPNNAAAYLGLAEIYIDTNLLDAALEYIKKAENNKCDLGHSRYLRGKIFLLKGNIAEAEKVLLQSNSVDSINALGTIYDEREEHAKAQNMYKKVISINPNYIDAYNNLGLSLLLDERYNDAIFYLENACSLPEANVTYRSNLAMAYGLAGNINKARAVYAQDFEGEELEEKVVYLEDLLATKQRHSRVSGNAELSLKRHKKG